MNSSRAKFLVALAAGLAAGALLHRPPEPVEPVVPPRAAARADGWPAAVVLRAIAKDQLARDVAAGRRSLPEAAALFRELNRLPPVPTDSADLSEADLSMPIPGRTDEERYCQRVVTHVQAALHHDPDRAAAVVARLAAEFREELDRHGAIGLPDPAALEPVQGLLQRAGESLTEAQWKVLLGP
jgi:hypothetical protein